MFPLKDNIPTRRFPVITVALIAINVVMFFAFQHAHWSGNGFAVSEKQVVKYAYIPYELTHSGKECGTTVDVSGGGTVDVEDKPICEGQSVNGSRGGDPVVEKVTGIEEPGSQPTVWLTILFSMFMHGGLLHIAGNMVFLWIFGNNVEDSMGRPAFVGFYLLGGLAATLLQTVVDPNSTVPNLGASGAIAAVLGGYALIYPRARVATLVFIIALLMFLTVRQAIHDGIDVVVVISFVVLALVGVGVLGALNAPRDE